MATNIFQEIIDSVIEGITILRKYDEKCSIGGEHDVIWCHVEDGWNKVSDPDKDRLKKIGWIQENEGDNSWQCYI